MKLRVLLPAIMIVALAGCKRELPNAEETVNNDVTSSQDLKVPASFDYATVKDITVDVKLVAKSGEPMSGIRVDVLDRAKDGISKPRVLATAITDKTGGFNVPVSLATYLTSVVIYPYAMGVPVNVEVPVQGNTVSFHYIQGKVQGMVIAPSNEGVNNNGGFTRRAGVVDKFNFKLGTYTTNGTPNYLYTPEDTLTTAFLARITSALPESKPVPQYHPQYISGYLPAVEVNQTSDVWVTFIHEGASYKNILLYYKYHKNSPPTSASAIDSLYVVYPNVSYNGSGGGLAAGNKVQIGRFGPDTVIAFAIAANGFNNSNQVTAGLNIWYSHRDFNNEAASFKDHVIMLKDDSTKRFIIAFEDVKRDAGQSDQDFNDVVFYTSANPVTGIDNPDLPPLQDPDDCDGDGVGDFYDDYPCDPTKAYDRYYPSETEFGTLAYEDLWPSTGDYDMNDLVVRWRFHAVVNASNNVLEFNCKAYVDAKGASLPGGFGIEFPFNASTVSQVTGSQITQNRVTLTSKGLENGHTKAVVILFDEASDQLTHPGGSFFNTRNFSPVAYPDTININMTFTGNMSFTSLGAYPFNPFIFTSQRNVEVHLPNKNNTALANTALFGTSRDNTIPSSNRYYKTVNNLPWAIHVPVQFNYPSERADIVSAHLKFAAWVQSNGTQSSDWYEDKTGYRNTANVFHR